MHVPMRGNVRTSSMAGDALQVLGLRGWHRQCKGADLYKTWKSHLESNPPSKEIKKKDKPEGFFSPSLVSQTIAPVESIKDQTGWRVPERRSRASNAGSALANSDRSRPRW